MKQATGKSDADWLRNILLDSDADSERLHAIAARLEALDNEVIPAMDGAVEALDLALFNADDALPYRRVEDARDSVRAALAKVRP